MRSHRSTGAVVATLVITVAGCQADERSDNHDTDSERDNAAASVPTDQRALERPRGVYVELPPHLQPAERGSIMAANGMPTIVYMNKDGGIYTPGQNDSANNVSSIPNFTAQVPAWQISDAGWQQVMDCTRAMWAPFNVIITDEDPGDVDHIESVVAGRPQDIGMQNGVGGVSPFFCGVIDRSIVFTFAEVYGNNLRAVCETAAQEVAHSFGLDHEYLCEDPMTYLGGCGAKSFKDIAAPCGEFSARQCSCGGSTQNSVAMMLDLLGPADAIEPMLSIDQPLDGAVVDPGFEVIATATDNVAVQTVDLFIDDQLVASLEASPFVFATSPELSPGVHSLRVVASDGAQDSTQTIAVTVSAPNTSCDQATPCPNGLICVDGSCEPDPNAYPPGTPGAYCQNADDCDSGVCATNGEEQRCTQPCNPDDEATCPDGFNCLPAGPGSVCWPDDGGGDEQGGGCAVGSGGGPAGILVLLALIAIGRRRRDP